MTNLTAAAYDACCTAIPTGQTVSVELIVKLHYSACGLPLAMTNLTAAAYHACCAGIPTGQATPLIDIHDVEHVTLTNVTVTSQQPAQPGGAWQQLPYTGITIKSLSGGVPIVNLDGVIVAKMVDGVTVVGGGNLSATNLRSSHNHNMGLYYMCSMVQQSSLVVAGRSTISNNGGLGTPVQEGEDERGVGELQYTCR